MSLNHFTFSFANLDGIGTLAEALLSIPSSMTWTAQKASAHRTAKDGWELLMPGHLVLTFTLKNVWSRISWPAPAAVAAAHASSWCATNWYGGKILGHPLMAHWQVWSVPSSDCCISTSCEGTTCNQLAPSDLHASHAKLSRTESRHRKTEAIASSVCGKWIVGSFINHTCSCSDKSEDAGTSKVSRVQLGCFNSLAGAPRVAQQVTYRFARKWSPSKLGNGTFGLHFLAVFGAFKMHCNAWSEKCFDTPACTKFEGGISISESIHKTNQTGHTSFGSSSFGAASTLDSAFGALRWWLWEILYGEYGEYVWPNTSTTLSKQGPRC